ncbi:uncharacterized protein FMAN_15291 [Fusarium mangiferae]|uniref:Uncharacterized protein n=1 Tax=Fusarium mangiferae TaxID=192010 RepID=A0A1L7U8V8_FUSMA|nr:uncharacterized protein FMAN_15291 [Fusarium mangiferae]CVL07150.1 uncharacterized protein FMAN_15291 [Fusarium mangiferae]
MSLAGTLRDFLVKSKSPGQANYLNWAFSWESSNLLLSDKPLNNLIKAWHPARSAKDEVPISRLAARNILVNLSSDQIRQLRLYSLLEIEEAKQDIKTAEATLQKLQHQEIATTQDEHQPSAMRAIVNALVAIVALFLALFGFGISNAPTEEESKNAAAVKKVSLERKKAEKRIKRAEAHMRALDRLVEAQQLDIGDNGTGSWEMLGR